jgi:hypothetical protein
MKENIMRNRSQEKDDINLNKKKRDWLEDDINLDKKKRDWKMILTWTKRKEIGRWY